MIRSAKTFFVACRFLVRSHASGEFVGVNSVYCDPFTGDILMGRAHQEGAGDFRQLLGAEGIDVFLLSRPIDSTPGATRKITLMDYQLGGYYPFDLDAQNEYLAMEWIRLSRPHIAPVEDIGPEDAPAEVLKALDPRRRHES